MTGIIELGNESDSVHESLGQRMAKSVNLILLRNKQFESVIKKGLGEKSNRLILIDDIVQLIKRTDEILNLPNTVILLEGKLPQKLLELVKGYK
jgi:UDP-N-acetylmuramyl pentapeptide synthase